MSIPDMSLARFASSLALASLLALASALSPSAGAAQSTSASAPESSASTSASTSASASEPSAPQAAAEPATQDAPLVEPAPEALSGASPISTSQDRGAVPEAPAATTTPTASEPVEPVEPSALPSASATSGDFEVGISGSDGAYIRTHDRAWSLRIGILGQVRAGVSTTPDPTREVEFVPVMARLYLQGSAVQPWIRYFLQTEFAGQQNPFPSTPVPEAPRLLDMWVEAQPHEAIGVRAGLMRPAFTRSWITGLQRQLVFDRSDANLFFRQHGPVAGGSSPGTQQVVPWDRDLGVMVFGTPADGLFEYYAGVFNGNGFLLGRQEAVAVMPMVRLAINPLGRVAYDETPAVTNPHQPLRFQVGVAGYYNHYRAVFIDPNVDPAPAPQGLTEEQLTLGTDVTAQFESVYLSTEIYYRNRRTVDGARHDEVGAMALAGWMFFAPYLELAARFSLIDPNLAATGDFRQVYDASFNVYPAGNNLRFGLRYSFSMNDAVVRAGGPGQPFDIPAGTQVHSVSLWSQFYF